MILKSKKIHWQISHHSSLITHHSSPMDSNRSVAKRVIDSQIPELVLPVATPVQVRRSKFFALDRPAVECPVQGRQYVNSVAAAMYWDRDFRASPPVALNLGHFGKTTTILSNRTKRTPTGWAFLPFGEQLESKMTEGNIFGTRCSPQSVPISS